MVYSLTPANTHNSNKYFLLALGVLNILCFTLLFCALGFMAGLSISKWQFLSGTICALVVNYFAARFFMGKKGLAIFFKSTAVILGLSIAFVLFSGFFYDISYDGQWYHMETVYQLKQGYNPVYQNMAIPPDEVAPDLSCGWCLGLDKPAPKRIVPLNPILNAKYISMNHFSKGTEFLNTALYQLTNRIETGKAVNAMMLAASFFLCLALLYRVDGIGPVKKWLLAFLFAFNPIAIVQLLTFCVDGNLASLLLCLLAISGLLFLNANRYYLFLLASVIILAVNVKFTGLLFGGIFCAGFLVMLLVYKKRTVFKQVLITGFIAALIGVFCCGFNPYVTNFMQQHDVFYGVNQTLTVNQRLTPALLQDCNRFEKLFFSLSAHEGWHSADKKSLWEIPKIPFTINMQDIREVNDAEEKLSGFGPFFSGALLLVTALFVVCVIKLRKSGEFRLGMAVFLIILLSVFSIPVGWWARYAPQFWLLPVIILIISEFIPGRSIRWLKGLVYVSLLLNIAWASLNIIFNLFVTVHANYQMEQLKALHQPVNVEYCPLDGYKSNRVRFYEWGIPFTVKTLTGPNVYNVISSNTRFETPAPLPDLPEPFLMRLGEKINGVTK